MGQLNFLPVQYQQCDFLKLIFFIKFFIKPINKFLVAVTQVLESATFECDAD